MIRDDNFLDYILNLIHGCSFHIHVCIYKCVHERETDIHNHPILDDFDHPKLNIPIITQHWMLPVLVFGLELYTLYNYHPISDAACHQF